jgi:hypothetical protein
VSARLRGVRVTRSERLVVDFSLGMEQRICEFGFPGPLRDRLVDAVLSGVKAATSSLLADWERDGEEPPAAGGTADAHRLGWHPGGDHRDPWVRGGRAGRCR